jgi:hypothetical protein
MGMGFRLFGGRIRNCGGLIEKWMVIKSVSVICHHHCCAEYRLVSDRITVSRSFTLCIVKIDVCDGKEFTKLRIICVKLLQLFEGGT